MEYSSKNYNIKICTIKKITNIVDQMDKYFIFIFHFDIYPFFNFQTHTNHRVCIMVRNMSQLLELIFHRPTPLEH
jgi:hypothetical protein